MGVYTSEIQCTQSISVSPGELSEKHPSKFPNFGTDLTNMLTPGEIRRYQYTQVTVLFNSSYWLTVKSKRRWYLELLPPSGGN